MKIHEHGKSSPAFEMKSSEQVAFLNTILEASTDHSIVAVDLEGELTEPHRLEALAAGQHRALVETTAFLNSVLDAFTEYSIIAKDLQARVQGWNEGARRNYGYTAAEVLGRDAVVLLHERHDVESGRVHAFLASALAAGKAEAIFVRVRKDGSRFTALVGATVRRGLEGQPIGFVIISKDITEHQRLEEELRKKHAELEEQNHRLIEATRLKSEFLANMSHELRTPLNGIIGFAELMHDGRVGPVGDDHKEYLGDILASSRHLLQLMNDVLDLAKVESGKMDFRPEPVDAGRQIGEVRDILKTLADTKQINVSVVVDPSLTDLVLDPARLKQVLYNYLSNALKFTPDGGTIAVTVAPEGPDAFRLSIRDTGIGVQAADLSRLFVEFQQLDASLSKKHAGTGLGLALTLRIVEAQGGRVGVTSAPGEGSDFFAVLPRAPRTASDVLPLVAHRLGGGRRGADGAGDPGRPCRPLLGGFDAGQGRLERRSGGSLAARRDPPAGGLPGPDRGRRR